MEKKIEKEILNENTNKKGNIKYRVVIIILSSIIGLLTIITITFSVVINNRVTNYPDNLSVLYYNKNYSDENEKVKDTYGLKIGISLNLDRHPKFKEWEDSLGFECDRDNYEKMVELGYFKKISESYYETIKEKFANLKCIISNESYYLSFYYYVNEKCDKTIKEAKIEMNQIKNNFFKSKYFNNFVKISNEDCINMISINIFLPSNIIKERMD